MKITGKILVFLLVLSSIFSFALLGLYFFETSKFDNLKNELIREKKIILNKTIDIKTETIDIYAYDYSYWDEMVDFVFDTDPDWAFENLETTVESYNAQVVWVLDKEHNLLYTFSTLNNDPHSHQFIDISIFKAALEKNYFSHFFTETDKGIFEIRTAPVQPSRDIERVYDPFGFFIVGKHWNKDFLNELGKINSSSITFSKDINGDKECYHDRFSIKNVYHLYDVNDNVLATIISESKMYMLVYFVESLNLLIVISAVFFIMIVLIIFLFLKKIITKPLERISQSLKNGNTDEIQDILVKKDEIGKIAKLIYSFFDQKKSLVEEIEKRKQSELLQNSLYEISDATNKASTLSNLCEKIHNIVRNLMYAENFYITLYDEGDNLLRFPYYVDTIDPDSSPVKAEKTLSYKVIKSGKPFLVKPENQQNLLDTKEIDVVGIPSIDWLGVPLLKDGKAYGALVVQSYDKEARYSEEHLKILTFVSEHVSTAIEKQQTQEELNKALGDIKVAYQKLENTQNDLITIEKKNTLLAIAATANHEINQPLMIIKGFLELLQSSLDQSLNEKQQRYINGINESLERIEKILNKLKKVQEPSVISYTEGTDMIEL